MKSWITISMFALVFLLLSGCASRIVTEVYVHDHTLIVKDCIHEAGDLSQCGERHYPLK